MTRDGDWYDGCWWSDTGVDSPGGKTSQHIVQQIVDNDEYDVLYASDVLVVRAGHFDQATHFLQILVHESLVKHVEDFVG